MNNGRRLIRHATGCTSRLPASQWQHQHSWRRQQNNTTSTVPAAIFSTTTNKDESDKSNEEAAPAVTGGVERWAQLVPAFAVLNAGGSLQASAALMTPELMRLHGVVAASSLDWTFSEVGPLATSVGLGAAATGLFFAEPIDRLGPRKTLMAVGGLGVTSAAIAYACAAEGWLAPLYLSTFCLQGPAFMMAYSSMAVNAQRWFPDRRGLAASITLSGFGAGAAVWAPIYSALLAHFKRAPEYAGSLGSVPLETVNGVRYLKGSEGALPPLPLEGTAAAANAADAAASAASSAAVPHVPAAPLSSEVVVATAADLLSSGQSAALEAGVYLVDSGSTGYLETLASVAGIMAVVHFGCAAVVKAPPALSSSVASASSAAATAAATDVDDDDDEKAPSSNSTSSKNSTTSTYFKSSEALACVTSPQGLALMLGTYAAGAASLPLIMNAKLIVTDVWGPYASSGLLAAAPVAAYLGGLSLGSTAGRLVLGPLSDKAGRFNVYALMLALQVPALASLPYFASAGCYSGVANSALSSSSSSSSSSLSSFPLSSLPSLEALSPDAALQLFMAASCASTFCYGGYTAMLPPVVGDVFGSQRVGVVFPRVFAMLNVASTSGTMAFSMWRAHATERACAELTAQVEDPALFESTFGAPPSALPELLEAKTVTVSHLMTVVPAGTLDPSAVMHHEAFAALAGMSALAATSNMAALWKGPYAPSPAPAPTEQEGGH